MSTQGLSPEAISTSDSTMHLLGHLMSERSGPSSDANQQPAVAENTPTSEDLRHAQRNNSRQKRGGGKGRSAYSFPDDLERCFCRNAHRVPPVSFPVTRREGAALPAMVELIRTETQVLFCDLLHEGPHVWPNGDEVRFS